MASLDPHDRLRLLVSRAVDFSELLDLLLETLLFLLFSLERLRLLESDFRGFFSDLSEKPRLFFNVSTKAMTPEHTKHAYMFFTKNIHTKHVYMFFTKNIKDKKTKQIITFTFQI